LKGENSSFTVISLDSYYKGLDHPEMAKDYNFDHPDALDWDLAFENL
jgi:uridine kinase